VASRTQNHVYVTFSKWDYHAECTGGATGNKHKISMIFIGLGANLDSVRFGPPLATLEAAVRALDSTECRVTVQSGWFCSSPVPLSDQPLYINGVIQLETELSPTALLRRLHQIEDDFGRDRGVPNAARVLDLDLLVYHDSILEDPRGPLVPHPRMHQRAFVLLPLFRLTPEWIHPRLGLNIHTLIDALPADQDCWPLDPADS
jgi:2-amino-4-hydroxy-6-hydroxymethyldihydropteridine diphosphokinase